MVDSNRLPPEAGSCKRYRSPEGGMLDAMAEEGLLDQMITAHRRMIVAIEEELAAKDEAVRLSRAAAELMPCGESADVHSMMVAAAEMATARYARKRRADVDALKKSIETMERYGK